MYSSYLFIPADKLRFVEKAATLQADYIIFDMEESVSKVSLGLCIENIRTLKTINKHYYVRIPVDYKDCQFAIQTINHLYQLGFRTFILPKLQTAQELDDFIKQVPHEILTNIRLGLLVETPKFLIEFYHIAKTYQNLISVVLIGSHDYCNLIGCEHTEDNLLYIKLKLLVECKALNIPLVDCVSTDFKHLDKFETESVASCNRGFDGRALIHPNQLEAFNNAKYYTKEEVKEATNVMKMVDAIDKDSFSTLSVDGKLYEKPHLKRLYNIAEWHQKHHLYDI